MEKIKVVIVEDEFVIAEDIRFQLEQSGYEVVAIFDTGESALPYLISESFDALLVDIHLAGKLSGIELVKAIRETLKVPVIYITANSDATTYARARETRPQAFLVKPFSTANLLSAIDLALYHFSSDSTPDTIGRPEARNLEPEPFTIHDCLFIRTVGKYKKVCCDDILFIEAAGSYVNIQTKQERYTLAQNLSHFQKRTTLPNLIRIHRSYMINLNHVDSFEDSFIYIKDHKLPLSENFKGEFMTKLRLF